MVCHMGARSSYCLLLPCQVHEQGAVPKWSKGTEPALLWDTGTAGVGLTCCATMLALLVVVWYSSFSYIPTLSTVGTEYIFVR